MCRGQPAGLFSYVCGRLNSLRFRTSNLDMLQFTIECMNELRWDRPGDLVVTQCARRGRARRAGTGFRKPGNLYSRCLLTLPLGGPCQPAIDGHTCLSTNAVASVAASEAVMQS